MYVHSSIRIHSSTYSTAIIIPICVIIFLLIIIISKIQLYIKLNVYRIIFAKATCFNIVKRAHSLASLGLLWVPIPVMPNQDQDQYLYHLDPSLTFWVCVFVLHLLFDLGLVIYCNLVLISKQKNHSKHTKSQTKLV